MNNKGNFVNCNNCGANNTKLLSKASLNGFISNYVQCQKCSLVYTNPQPSEAYLMNLYNENYFKSESNNFGYSAYGNEEQDRINKCKEYLSIIERFTTKGKRVLDIGAGFGYFLIEAQRHGWEVYGVELSKHAKDEAKKRFNIDFVESLGELAFLKKYNLITMFDFIEHVRNPMDTLNSLSNLSNEEGLLVIRVPVIDSKEGIRKGDNFFKVDHLYNFSKDIITGMITKVGYNILKIIDEPAHAIIVARKS